MYADQGRIENMYSVWFEVREKGLIPPGKGSLSKGTLSRVFWGFFGKEQVRGCLRKSADSPKLFLVMCVYIYTYYSRKMEGGR